MADPQADQHPVRLAVLATSLAAVLVAVAVAYFLRNIFVSARTPIVWTVAAVVLTALLTPIVNALGRKIPRVIAAAAVLLALAGAFFVVGYRFVDDLSTGVERLRVDLPKAASELEANSHLLQEFDLTKRVTEWANQLPNQSIQPTNAASTAVNFFVAGTVTLFLLLYGPRILEAGFRQIRDVHRRTELRRFALVAMVRTQRYVVGSLAGMTAFGVATYIICRVIDIPTPTPLAVIVGLLAALPYFGVLLGAVPLLLLDGGLNSPGHAGYLLLLFAVMQVAQVQLWKRWVQPRSLYVGPAVIAVVGLIGFDLYGLGGLLFSSVIGVFLLALGDAASNSNVRWAGRPPASVAAESTRAQAVRELVCERVTAGTSTRGPTKGATMPELLVDRFRVVVFPVITGSSGRDRIYDGYPDVALDMVASRTFDGPHPAARVHAHGPRRSTWAPTT